MRIQLLAIGDRMPRRVADGFDTYARRLRGKIRLQLVEVQRRVVVKMQILHDLSGMKDNGCWQKWKSAPTVLRLTRVDAF